MFKRKKKTGKKQLSNWSLLLRTWSGKIGVALLIIQLLLAIYVVAAYGETGLKEYTQSNKWSYLYPQSAPPCWATDKAPPAKVSLEDMQVTGPEASFQVADPKQQLLIDYFNAVYVETVYEGSFNYEAEGFPSDTALALIVEVGKNATVNLQTTTTDIIILEAYVERPDGLKVYFYDGKLPVGESGTVFLYGQVANITEGGENITFIKPYSLNKIYQGALIEQYFTSSIKQLEESLGYPDGLPGLQQGQVIMATVNEQGQVVPLNGEYKVVLRIGYFVDRDLVLNNGQFDPNLAKQNDAYVEPTVYVFEVKPNCYGFFGTDTKSRPIGLGLLFGLPYAFILGFSVTFISTFIGAFYGTAAGYWKDIKGEIMMRVVDIVNSLPFLPILIALSVAFRSAITLPVLAGLMIILFWAGPVIVVRSMALQISEQIYVEAARAVGASTRRILFKHMFPQIFPYTMAIAVLSIPGVIVAEASLSLLGFGDPAAPTWGKMLQLAYDVGAVNAGYWWLYLFPGLALVIFSATFLLLGRALEPIVAPKLVK
ncbi:MAG: ABC transporter permease [Desulfurococcales archaeon]|nr:ABC transporter permease [Desulfurococcales archaeon]